MCLSISCQKQGGVSSKHKRQKDDKCHTSEGQVTVQGTLSVLLVEYEPNYLLFTRELEHILTG